MLAPAAGKRLAFVLLVVSLALPAIAAPPAAVAATAPKVVVVVGPTGRSNALYKSEAREIIAEARRYTSNVVAVFTPYATWARVARAAQGASIFVYFGHGNGYPSRYGPYQGLTKNGMGLDPAYGADGYRHVNYGEDRIRASIRFAKDSAVLLYRLCYASGNTEPGLSVGSFSAVRQRVDNYGAGFLAAGARVVIADGHPWPSPFDYVRQLFRTDRNVWQVFRSAPNYHRHILGPYWSSRTPGMRFALDPDRGGIYPSGFYRSIVGDLSLRTKAITKRLPPPPVVAAPSPTPDISPTPDGSAMPETSPTPGGSLPPDSSSGPSPSADAEPTPTPTPTPSPTPDGTAPPDPTPDTTPTPDVGPTPEPSTTSPPDPPATDPPSDPRPPDPLSEPTPI